MGWLIFEFLVEGLMYNIVFIIFGLIAQSRAAKGKSYVGWIIVGSIITFLPYFGTFAGMSRNPEIYKLSTLIAPFISYLILLFLFIAKCKKGYTEGQQQIEESDNLENNTY